MSDNGPVIYLDHAATTPVRPAVWQAMQPYFGDDFGNPASLHRVGQRARRALDEARHTTALAIGCTDREVIFTSGGSESNNLAIRSIALAYRDQGRHIITTQVEHHAVLRTCAQLESHFGFDVTYLPVDARGRVDPEDVRLAITPQTTLISVMYANNEVGTVQPIAEIGRIAAEHGVLFHTDAVQAAGWLDLDVNQLGVDLVSLSAHKCYGPKGVGVLYVRQGLLWAPSQTGGAQQHGHRAGTENVAGIVGGALALKLAQDARVENRRETAALRDRLIHGVLDRVPNAGLTGDPRARLANSASFVFRGAWSEALVIGLDLAGICSSGGSACASNAQEASHVLEAMGFPEDVAACSLRLTLGPENNVEQVDYVLDVLPGIVRRTRELTAGYALAM